MKKRVLTVLLALVMVLSLALPASATFDLEDFAEELATVELFRSVDPASVSLGRFDSFARDLQSLDLFRGVAPSNLELDRAPTRAEALVMLIRLLGVEEAAQASSYDHPFTDADMWARNYIGFAYEHGLTTGTTATTFSPNAAASAQMYVTFALRALGFDDAAGDFTFANALDFGMQNFIWDPLLEDGTFTRGHMVAVSYLTLGAPMANEPFWLIDVLVAEGAVDATAAAPIIAQIELYEDYHFLRDVVATSVIVDGSAFVTIVITETYGGQTHTAEVEMEFYPPQHLEDLLFAVELPFTTLVLITEISKTGNVFTMNLREAYLMAVVEILANDFIEVLEAILTELGYDLEVGGAGNLTGSFEEQITVDANGNIVHVVMEESFSWEFLFDGIEVYFGLHQIIEVDVAQA